MPNIFTSMDINGVEKTSDMLFLESSGDWNIYIALYDGKYAIDYSSFNQVRLVFMEIKGLSNVYTLSSIQTETVNNVTYVKVEVPSNLVVGKTSYEVRTNLTIDGNSKTLPKFKAYTYPETPDSKIIFNMINTVNNIWSGYLASIKREDIGRVNGVLPLDEFAKVAIQYMPENIIEHIELEHSGHDTRMNKDRMLEYYDYQDEAWYELNSLHGGVFGTSRKDSQYSYHGGIFK